MNDAAATPHLEPSQPGWREQRLTKTDAGRTEIRSKALPLSRPARNLLLIIDHNRTVGGWLDAVQGCTETEIQSLITAGLVQVQAAVAAPAPAGPRPSLAQALESKSYQTLYNRLTAEARPRLGLIKGYKIILDVERCNGPQELRALAQRFVDLVREHDGDAAALSAAQALVAPG
jgi:hypothetical protein